MKKGFGRGGEDRLGVSESLLRQARKSGQLNLSNRQLERVPQNVWHLNEIDAKERAAATAMDANDDAARWWEQVDLVKLILASNRLTELPDEIGRFPALHVLDVHDNRIASISREIGKLGELKKLNLSHNVLETLVDEMGSLVEMTLLFLQYNRLTDLGSVLNRLERLEELDVSHNRLTALPDSMGLLSRLRQMNASHNLLTALPRSMGELVAIQDLDLSNNRLDVFPPIAGMKSIQRLNLQHNRLSNLSSPKTECLSLKEIYLGNNELLAVDAAWLRGFPALIILDIRDNKLSSFPAEVTGCLKLERLDLSNNDISGLPYEMGNMAQLKSLALAGNPLKKLRRDIVQRGTAAILSHLKSRIVQEQEPPNVREAEPVLSGGGRERKLEFRNKRAATIPSDLLSSAACAGVSEVDFSRNALTEFPDGLCQLRDSMRTLSLAHNKLSSLSSAIVSCVQLTRLDLSANSLFDLPDVQPLSNLLELIISYNRFSRIPESVFKIKTLETLLASDNQLCEIDVDGLRNLKRLTSLDMQNNSIAQVPPELGKLNNLRALKLSGNSFRVPRPAVLAKGTEAILQYLRDRIPDA
ncbi:leucine-rich repeat-containing protein 40-like isoform X1 [Oscarella lobularis]|uniref:leucine-rich repeat-containing protein 40-like isoform X1 n=1 Tax=Oscarella lobularis TaxID=121494 RepID=UPI003313B11E